MLTECCHRYCQYNSKQVAMWSVLVAYCYISLLWLVIDSQHLASPPILSIGDASAERLFGNCLDIGVGDELGNRDLHDTSGLLSLQLWREARSTRPNVQRPAVLILKARVICLSPSKFRSARVLRSSASLLIEYSCNGEACPDSPNGKGSFVHMLYLKCGIDNTWQLYTERGLSTVWRNPPYTEISGDSEIPIPRALISDCSICYNVQEENDIEIYGNINTDFQCVG